MYVAYIQLIFHLFQHFNKIREESRATSITIAIFHGTCHPMKTIELLMALLNYLSCNIIQPQHPLNIPPALNERNTMVFSSFRCRVILSNRASRTIPACGVSIRKANAVTMRRL